MRATQQELKTIPLPTYKREKIRMLTQDFRIKMTAEEKAHLNDLPTEVAVDRYARDLFMRLA